MCTLPSASLIPTPMAAGSGEEGEKRSTVDNQPEAGSNRVESEDGREEEGDEVEECADWRRRVENEVERGAPADSGCDSARSVR